MSEPCELTLAGFYRPRPGKPGFALAVFQNDEGYWVQQAEKNLITGFLRCEFDEANLLSVEKSGRKTTFLGANTPAGKDLLVRKIGDQKILGFSCPDGALNIGLKNELARVLANSAKALEQYPFVLKEVAKFSGKSRLMARAKVLTAAALNPLQTAVTANIPKKSTADILKKGPARPMKQLRIGDKFVKTEGVEIGDRVRVFARIPRPQIGSRFGGRPNRSARYSGGLPKGNRIRRFVGVVLEGIVENPLAVSEDILQIRYQNPRGKQMDLFATKIEVLQGRGVKTFRVPSSLTPYHKNEAANFRQGSRKHILSRIRTQNPIKRSVSAPVRLERAKVATASAPH